MVTTHFTYDVGEFQRDVSGEIRHGFTRQRQSPNTGYIIYQVSQLVTEAVQKLFAAT